MMRFIKVFFYITVGAIGFALFTYLIAPKAMIEERVSPYNFDTTVETIVENVKQAGWEVPKIYDFQQSLLQHEQTDVGRINVIEICYPIYASQILSTDTGKSITPMMPCAVGVYEKNDGHTYVASMNVGLMAKLFGDPIAGPMGQVAAEDEKVMAFLN